MATFLKICQDVARDCGVAGGADASPRPTTVTGQSGELNRIIHWVIDAYEEIQGSKDWRWLRKDFTFDTTPDIDAYAHSAVTDVDSGLSITRFREWRITDKRNPPKLYLTSSGITGQTLLVWIAWDEFEYLYKTGAIQAQTSKSVHITNNPKDELVLGMSPNDVYTITGSYHMSAQVLCYDADVPEMPPAYHSLIKYQAMEYYGLYESAPEVISRAQRGMSRIMNQLNRNQGTRVRFGRPLV